jgi:ankyrin repeat protein
LTYAIITGLQKVVEAHRDIAQEQLEIQQKAVRQKLSDTQNKCLQSFLLTTGNEHNTYEWYKNRVEDRVQGTCMWFLDHNYFQKWLKQESGPLLVSADPGCGKSVLAKYLIDHALPRSATICYFFFKDQDQNKFRQALCALLHRLFSKQSNLIHHATKQFEKDGPGLINSTMSLWAILGNATKDPQAGPVIIVLDALDECDQSQFKDLMRGMVSQLRSNRSGHGKVRYLLTSRPYEQIMSNFRGLLDVFPRIHIPGEEESETISQEVNRVIEYRVEELAVRKALSDRVKRCLANRLLEITHRTYLWVYLVFDDLEKADFKKTPKGVESRIAMLPKDVNQAYEGILKKTGEHGLVRKALSIMLAASRALTLSEMNIAININNTSQSIDDLDLEEETDFQSRLRSCCGLFVSIYHGKVYFIHQTAREFLLENMPCSMTNRTKPEWYHSIAISHAHTVLVELCVRYLCFFNSESSLPNDTTLRDSHIDTHAFLDYSAKFWVRHLREAYITDENRAIESLALRICDPESTAYSVWFEIHQRDIFPPVSFPTGVLVASYFGQIAVVKQLIEDGADLESKDDEYGRTPLSWAAENGHEPVVKLLIEKGADLESKDNEYGRTPLSWAAENGHDSVVKLLVEEGADLESKDNEHGRTPLSWAAENGHDSMVKLLIEDGADLESKDDEYGRTPLSWAAENGHEPVVKLLIEKGADLESKDNEYGRTPPSWAAGNAHESVVKVLVKRGAKLESKDKKYGQAPLSWAAEKGHEVVVELLLKTNKVNINVKDTFGRMPLSWAAEKGHEAVVKLLYSMHEVNIDVKDIFGRTPLSWATEKGHKAVVELLLDTGRVDVDAKDKNGHTPLWQAAGNGHEAVVKLLLDTGKVDINVKDTFGRTPLSWAAEKGHEAVVKLLHSMHEVNIDVKDIFGRTPLSWAA